MKKYTSPRGSMAMAKAGVDQVTTMVVPNT